MHWASTRRFFPVTKELAYLNHAGVAPISTRVAEAIARYSEESAQRGAFDYSQAFDREIERVRGTAASLLGARREEIAFVKNTTEGIGHVAAGIDWKKGDKVVTCDLEYPSNVYPWWHLRDLGVETVMLPSREGRLPSDAIEEALADPRVRLLALSSVEFGSGARNNLQAIGEICRDHGVLFCVDAIQSLGCLPIDVERSHIDFLAADGHKWLLSVEGCGIFYCAQRSLELLRPRVVGWRSVANNLDFDSYHMELQPNAGRFEEGTPNTPGIFALGAAIDLILEIGIEFIGPRVIELTDHLVEGLRERGAEILSPRDDDEKSGIVAFHCPGEEPKATVRRLRAAQVFTVARRSAVRASPHFYNDVRDLERLFAAL